MANSAMQINGLKELNAALKKLDKKVANKIARAGTAKMAQVLRKEMRRRAPVDTGDAKKHIRYKLKKLPGKNGFTGWVGPDNKAFYLRFIEEGAAAHFIPTKRKTKSGAVRYAVIGDHVYTRVHHPGIKAAPFLRPAYEATREEAVQQAEIKMRQLIDKEMQKP